MLVRVFLCLITLIPSSIRADVGDPEVGGEYAEKANFLYNIIHFVEWPTSAFISGTAPITIGIIGDDPFGSHLEKKIRDAKVQGRPIEIVRTRRVQDVAHYHLLFVSKSEEARLNAILAAVQGRDVIPVGETEEFLAAGGMIALTSEQGAVRLRINTTMVKESNVTISSKLLRIATQR